MKEKLASDMLRWMLDSRSQERYLGKGPRPPENLLDPAILEAHVSGLVDVEGEATGFSLPQPALGLFDERTLARVQAAFPYLPPCQKKQ